MMLDTVTVNSASHPNGANTEEKDGDKENYHAIVSTVRKSFESGKTKCYKFRSRQLRQLLKLCEDHQMTLAKALENDLRKGKFESYLCEIFIVTREVKSALKNLKCWMKPEKVEKDFATALDQAFIVQDPRGVILIISAWNYPVQLALMPLIGAIAAGNCVILKPSEIAVHTAQAFANLIPLYLDNECYQVVCGGALETTILLEEKFDFIMYTGSAAVGKIVRAASNKYLTPVALEMGGKSPLYLDDSCNMEYAVRRILWGKCINAGQTCIAPDYILCSKKVQSEFIKLAKDVLKEWYGFSALESPDYCCIINEAHFERLKGLLSGVEVVVGGKVNKGNRLIEPTIIVNVQPSHPVMQQEIFGPLLPIINVDTLQDAITFINERELPLTCYVFSNKKAVQESFLKSTSSGSVCINDTVSHFIVDTLPFGGIGSSGMGCYHGKYSFDTFTHKKSCLVKNFNPIGESFAKNRYPPYSEKKLELMKMIIQKYNIVDLKLVGIIAVFLFGLLIGICVTYFVR